MEANGQDTVLQVRSHYQREFDPGETLYVIQSGEVELTREGPSGQRVIARLGRGDFFGELGAVAGVACTTSAVAVKNTRLLELDRETLEAMCLEQPRIAIRLLRVVVSRLIEAERRLAALGVDDVLRPVVRGLVRNADVEAESGAGARIPVTLRRLSEDAGLSMLETHRALHQLFDRKLLRLVDDVLHVPDLEALSACLDQD